MPEFPGRQGASRIQDFGADTANSRGTTVTPSATNNTKGSWVELLSSTDFQALLSAIRLVGDTGGSYDWLVDISIGASGSEQVILENLIYSAKQANAVNSYNIPILIPKGVRIAARAQGSSQGNVYIEGDLIGPPLLAGNPGQRVTTYGANTGDSGGISIDPGGTADTKGSWTEMVSSTDHLIHQLVLGVGQAGNFQQSTTNWLIDIAFGASGSEQILVPNLQMATNVQGDNLAPAVFGPYPVAIPAGSRLAVRAQCSITDATDRLFDAVLYGVG